jgi:hypothetical protein
MRNRLTERDLSRIVRKVIREESTDVDAAADVADSIGKNKCFKNTTFSKPFSCTVPSFKGNNRDKECLRDLGGKMTLVNHEEIGKVMACIVTR